MTIYRTPDARFEGLPDWPYAPKYLEIAGGLRVHYVDEGVADAQPVLMLHGEPTWSYLWRHMIGPATASGFRVVAPDLIGFGRSDKPLGRGAYSYAAQVVWMRQWIEALDLQNIVLACQDWGSLIGLRLVAETPERFAGVALSNGGLPEGQPAPRAFAIWRAFSRYSPVFPIGKIVKAGAKRELSPAEIAAYDAPFPTRASKVAARVYPSFVPLGDNIAVPDQKRAWAELEAFDKPFLCCFSDGDPITRGGDALFTARVPGTHGMTHRTLKGGHFIQEDDPAGFVAAIRDVAAASVNR
ncbi:haloalkane dehalogenase [Sphingopyxis sp. H038]|jgi:haloalkane dehalogenase|uniref:haloalkane dehalogenase n=1 Tax=unclassified Sphingopyxis TaxID=2614943 RepID=UPI00072FB8F0|nr:MULTISPECIES: haloalkane dehalogenase [unclassified Sphingopyxis]KTE01131.1 haloalkane dehalogenase [Sphingopyxis sp. H012]KTE12481.1 haloalkane dehalogenase [Sphingopyxis sp. H053]KTE14181.1 haloalkane dehalogenase [Sphingopyxis sp. H093]KTE23403.1 haloalkane dehalogenase [Sphingopyxis sp. H080]KTE32615.1 haloalkane dehalogenase [Sphingopyxis sp. H077]